MMKSKKTNKTIAKKTNKTVDLAELPKDMILEIIKQLDDYQDIINFGKTAKNVHQITQDPSLSPIMENKLRSILFNMIEKIYIFTNILVNDEKYISLGKKKKTQRTQSFGQIISKKLNLKLIDELWDITSDGWLDVIPLIGNLYTLLVDTFAEVLSKESFFKNNKNKRKLEILSDKFKQYIMDWILTVIEEEERYSSREDAVDDLMIFFETNEQLLAAIKYLGKSPLFIHIMDEYLREG